MTSCSPTKYLTDDQTLLVENKVNIDFNEDITSKSAFKLDMERLIVQKPNGSFMFIPREYIWYANTEEGDSSWYNNFFRKYMGEKPALHQIELTETSALSMKKFLQNKKGFFNAQVAFDTIHTRRRTRVEYNITPNERYYVGDLTYLSRDTAILMALEEMRPEAIVREGVPIDASLFDLELSRIAVGLQNQGYANFSSTFIQIKGDSAQVGNKVNIYLDIRTPEGQDAHQKYTIGELNIYTDFHRDQDTSRLDQVQFKGKDFYRQSNKFITKPRMLDRKIFFEEGDLFTREARSKTYRKLSDLGTYRFVTLSPKISTKADSIIDYDILLTPFQNRWVADFGSDLFYSSLNQSRAELLGFSLSSLFKNRNLLRGSEQFSLTSETGVELQLSNPVKIRTLSLGLNAALEIPKQQDVLNLARGLKNLGLLRDKTYQSFREESTTTISAGWDFIDILDQYSISSYQVNYTYNYQPTSSSRFIIRQTALDLNLYNIRPNFNPNNLIRLSFQDNLLSGYLFRDITYLYTSPLSKAGNSYSLISKFEVSGWETYIANKLYNFVSGSSTDWALPSGIGFAKYFRVELDPRYAKYFSKKTSLATHFFAGIIVPFGGDQAAPFVRQFSVGGPYSLRAWNQRELGPGSYDEKINTPNNNAIFFQTGDIKLEFGLEYRFDIFWIMEGALFVDAGNIWTLREDVERPGTQFGKDFLKEIAVAAGYGIRFDLNYFNIRFDFGYKLRNPFTTNPGTNGGYWYTWDGLKDQGLGNLQVAINYPF